jgi:hypothetical protein
MIHSSGNVAAAGLMLGHSRKSSLTADVYAYLPPEMATSMIDGVEKLLAEVGERLVGDDIGQDQTQDVSETDLNDESESRPTQGGKWSDRGSNDRMTTQIGTTHARTSGIVRVAPART